MFKIADGREHFYQWDLDRQIIVEDPTITEVHFCNRTDDCSLVVQVEDLEIFADYKPISVLRTANVPNIILQKSFDIRVFGYDGKATRYDKVFEVKSRTKPADYVYTETEVKNFDTLQNYIDERLDKIAEEGIKADLTGYATEDYVDKAIENIDIPEPEKVDLTGYAKEQWVKDQGYLTEHQSLEGYATEKYVDDAIANIDIPEGGEGADLSNYYTKTETDELISGISQGNTYFFNAEAVEWVEGRGYTPAPDDLVEFAQRLLASEAVNLCVAQMAAGEVRWLPAEFYITKVNDVLCVEFLQGVSIADIGKEDALQIYRVFPDDTVGWAVARPASLSKFIADKTYVDNAIQTALSGIATAEGGAY